MENIIKIKRIEVGTSYLHFLLTFVTYILLWLLHFTFTYIFTHVKIKKETCALGGHHLRKRCFKIPNRDVEFEVYVE